MGLGPPPTSPRRDAGFRAWESVNHKLTIAPLAFSGDLKGGQKAGRGLEMTISIQGSTAGSLAPLGVLTTQESGAAPTPPGAPATAPVSDAIDLSGLTASAPEGPAAGLASTASIADAAAASGSLIEGLLGQMRDAAVSAADPSIGGDARAALNAGFQSGLSQIQAAIGAASVDGANLIDGSGGGQSGLASFDFSLGGPLIGVAAGANLNDPATAAGLAGQLDAALSSVGAALDTLGAQSDALQAGGLTAASSGGFDPGLEADGARLAALQVQQQLAGGGGSIGNQAPAAILALFR